MDRNLEKINDMMRSRSPQELIAAQSDLFRDNLEGFLQSSRRWRKRRYVWLIRQRVT
jgi:hypothetical protein